MFQADMSPNFLDNPFSNLSQQDQLEALWSAVDQSNFLALMSRCIEQWASEHPHSATKLCFVLEWTWNKMNVTKEELDRLCALLFDGSCHNIDPQTIQSIHCCYLLLCHLNAVLNCLLAEAKSMTEEGILSLNNKRMLTQITCQYIQVVLWFCRFELLPEGFHDAMHLRSLCYNYPVIQEYYTSCRQKCESFSRGEMNPDYLIIDGLVSHLGNRIENLWRNDEGSTGKYPPPSLHALLDIYLLDNIPEANKHAVTIYLLLDIMSCFPNKEDSAIESFLKLFAISDSQLKLIKGLWYIDHKSYERALELLLDPATAEPLPWQHTMILRAFISHGEHRIALRYIHTMKPTMSTDGDVCLHFTILTYNRCVVEALSLLRQHSSSLNRKDLLKHTYDMCQEVGLLEDFLKIPLKDTEQEDLVRTLQTSPRIKESSPGVSSLPIPDASVGTPIAQASQKRSKELNTADCPVHQLSQSMRVFLQSPTKSPLDLPSHLLPVSSCVKRSWESITKAKELHCLETPLVAKKAKISATTVNASGFAKSSLQTILKSCRPSTLASPSLSPGPSLAPLQLKETTISLREEGITAPCTTGVAYDNKTNIYATTPPRSILKKPGSLKTRKKVSFSLDHQENENQELHVRLQDTSSHYLEKSDVSNAKSSSSTIMDQTFTEYQDAVSPKIMCTPLKTASSSTELIADVTEKAQDGNSNMVESEGSPPKMPRLSDTGNTEDILLSSLTAQQAEVPMSDTPRKRGRPRNINADDVTPTVHEEERSPKRRKDLSIQRRSTRNTSATTKNTPAGERASEKSVSVPQEELETVLSPK